MTYWLLRAINYTIAISVIISIFRLREIDKKYFPIIIFLWYWLLNEVLSDFSIYFFRTNALNSNLYILLSPIILIHQFERWKAIKLRLYYLSIGLVIFSWSIENLLYANLWTFNTKTSIFSDFIIATFSIKVLSQNALSSNKSGFDWIIFPICFALIFKHISSIIIEIFWIYGQSLSDSFLINIGNIFSYVNLLVNILFAYIVCKIPIKREFQWLAK
jgi:hypothetical protein